MSLVTWGVPKDFANLSTDMFLLKSVVSYKAWQDFGSTCSASARRRGGDRFESRFNTAS